MKLTLPKAKPLNQRGIAHLLFLVLMVVGIGVTGVYLSVSKHDSLGAAKNNKKVGYIVVHSGKGTYKAVKITNNRTDGAKCHVGKDDIKKLSAKHGTKIKCDAISQLASYNVKYDSTTGPIIQSRNIDVDAGYCVHVHPDPKRDNKVKVENGKCTVDEDVPPKQDIGIRPLVTAAKDNKSASGYVDVHTLPDGTNVTREMCVGSVNLYYGIPGSNSGAFNHPIKYAKVDGKAYCVARFKDKVNLQADKAYTLTAKFPGSAYFKAAEGSVQFPSAKN